MDGHQAINGLALNDDRFFNKQVQTVAAARLRLPIDYGQGLLLSYLHRVSELESQAGFISRF